MGDTKFEIIPVFASTLMRLVHSAINGDSLPADIKFVDCHYDYEKRVFNILASSDSFSPVPEGNMIPRRRLEIKCP